MTVAPAGALSDPAAPTAATLPPEISTARSGRYLPATESNISTWSTKVADRLAGVRKRCAMSRTIAAVALF